MSPALALVRADPRIAAAMLAPEAHGDIPRSILMVPDQGWLESEIGGKPRSEARALRGWETIYNLVYGKPDLATGPNFDGWMDSFTREPIPLAEMQHWVQAITSRLLALPHRRVREIGCGTGLLIEAVAPHCDHYEATDLSPMAVARLDAWLASRPDLTHVSVLAKPAHDVGTAEEPVDLVIINSVIQYFPDAAYLEGILETAWRSLLPGGHVVVGDVKALGTQAIFMSAVGLANAPDELTMGALRELVHAACLSQSELLVDPGFFHQFARSHGGSISILLKNGRSQTEMTRYRYDVIIAKFPLTSAAQENPVVLTDMAVLADWLASGQPGTALMRGLTNARLAKDRAAYNLMDSAHPATNVGIFRQEIAAHSEVGIDPADLEAIASIHGRSCACSPVQGSAYGDFDAWFNGMDGIYPIAPEPVTNPMLVSFPPLMLALRRLVVSLHGELSGCLESSEMPSRLLPVMDEEHFTARMKSMGVWNLFPKWAFQNQRNVLTNEETGE